MARNYEKTDTYRGFVEVLAQHPPQLQGLILEAVARLLVANRQKPEIDQSPPTAPKKSKPTPEPVALEFDQEAAREAEDAELEELGEVENPLEFLDFSGSSFDELEPDFETESDEFAEDTVDEDRDSAADVRDSVGRYIREIGQQELLSAQEEIYFATQLEEAAALEAYLAGLALLQEEEELTLEQLQKIEAAKAVYEQFPHFKDLDDKGKQQIRDAADLAFEQMTRANTRLVVSIARKHQGRGLPFLDLIQEGNIGLMKAVRKFDHHRGNRFSTYATWWIRQKIMRAVNQVPRSIRLPVHFVDEVNQIRRISQDLSQRLGKRPTPEEVSHELTTLKLSKELGREPTTPEIKEQYPQVLRRVIRLIVNSMPVLSLEMPVGDDDDGEFGEFIEDDAEGTEAAVFSQITREEIDAALSILQPRSQRLLRLRFGLEDGVAHTLEEIGQKLGVTRERVRQLEVQALLTLRRQRKKLAEYL